MTDARKILEEAVGSFEPRGDLGAVERRVERRRRRQRLSAGVVAFVVFAGGLWVAWSAFGPIDGTPGATPRPPAGVVVVPDVVGTTEDEARVILEELGLDVSITQVSTDEVDEGLVTAQDPSAGSAADAGATVTIIVNGGPALPRPTPIPGLPEAGVVIGFEDSVELVALNGTGVITLDGYTLVGNPGAPGVRLQRGDRLFSLDVEEHALVPVPADEGDPYDEGPAPSLPPPAEAVGVDAPGGRWRYAVGSGSDTTLAQWSGECEVPRAFLIDATGTARVVTGEGDPWSAPASIGLGWFNGEAVVLVSGSECAAAAEPPGVYTYAAPGSGRLLHEIETDSLATDAWGTGLGT
ncbi:MAG: PASTA domain-containing protein [Actinomycetota bacterium]